MSLILMLLSNCAEKCRVNVLDLLVLVLIVISFLILNFFEIAFPDQSDCMGLLSQDCKVKSKITLA